MSETASKSYVDSQILKHENKWVERTNKMKDNLSQIIQEESKQHTKTSSWRYFWD